MDPVSHLAGGLLTGRAYRRPLVAGAWLLVLCGLAAVAVDAEYVSLLFGPESFLTHYRGTAHSLVVTIGLGLLLFLAALPVRGISSRRGILAVVMFTALSHLYLDAFTIYGIKPLAPFSDFRIALDAVWFFDPIYFFLFAILLLGPIIFRTRGRITGWLGILLILAYPWGVVGVKHWAADAARDLLQANDAQAETIFVHPDFLSPVFWKVVSRSEQAYEVRSFNSVSRSLDPIPTLYEAAPPSLMERLAQESELVAAFLSRVPRPIIFRREGGDTTRLVIADLNMVSVTPWVKDYQPNGAPPMSLLLELGLDGALLDARMRYSGRYLSLEELPVSPQANASNSTGSGQ